MPLFLRISATDWLENEPGVDGWEIDDTLKLAEILASKGVDLLDCSSGGLDPRQKIKAGPGYQAVSIFPLLTPFSATKSLLLTQHLQPFAKAVKERLGDKLAVGTVGSITTGKQANHLLEEGLDLAIVVRTAFSPPAPIYHLDPSPTTFPPTP